MHIEIEVKAQFASADEQRLLAWLESNARRVGVFRQIDRYYDHPERSFSFIAPEGYKDAIDYLRVRNSDGRVSICLKRWQKDPVTGKLTHCEEFETEVANESAISGLLKTLGFHEDVVVDKTRRIYEVESFEISVDEIKNLGNFIEVELKREVATPQEGWELIYGFLRNRGIKTFSRMDRGYVSMLWNPGVNFGEEIVL